MHDNRWPFYKSIYFQDTHKSDILYQVSLPIDGESSYCPLSSSDLFSSCRGDDFSFLVPSDDFLIEFFFEINHYWKFICAFLFQICKGILPHWNFLILLLGYILDFSSWRQFSVLDRAGESFFKGIRPTRNFILLLNTFRSTLECCNRNDNLSNSMKKAFCISSFTRI